ncbi:MAG: sulfatase [Lachnospiraceae bacterium]
MKTIMVMFDSLNRKMLEPYGCDWIPTPNFKRLAKQAVTFDCNYVGSMPCMPARRELHTGRYNFQHRSWGPLEPFDDSMPEILKKNGIYTHLSTDHQHYWEDGGATYHSRYSSFDLNRGQEGDPWKVMPELIDAAANHQLSGAVNYFDKVNRVCMDREEMMPQAKTFQAGLEFLDNNHETDNWFLQIETFDPHEPFFTQPEYKAAFTHDYNGAMEDWPPYYFVTEGEDSVRHMRMEYAALITMCDHYLGKVLDAMDQYNLWEDTMLIVNTDHGFLLGEHGWWSKSIMPIYEEIARTPLFIYHPCSEVWGERRDAVTQMIDLPVTILDFFGLEIPKDMQGRSLLPVIEKNKKVRDYAIFGYHDAHCNLTDGRWVYMKAPIDGTENYEYTLMPSHMKKMFSPDELADIKLQKPFDFTKGCRTMRIKAREGMNDPVNFGTKLFDLKHDPNQEQPLDNQEKETELANEMIKLMHDNECPVERFARFGFPAKGKVTKEHIGRLKKGEKQDRIPKHLLEITWEQGAVNMYHTVKRFLPGEIMEQAEQALLKQTKNNHVSIKAMFDWIVSAIPKEQQPMIQYFAALSSRTA